MRRRDVKACLGLALALGACGRSDAPPAAAPASAAPASVAPASAPATTALATAAPATAAPVPKRPPDPVPQDNIQPGPTADLPPADRVFVAGDLLVAARGDRLWAAQRTGDTWNVLWITEPQAGVAHKVAFGDLGQGPRLYVAWGVGRGFLAAPLVLRAHDPATGVGTEIWRDAGQRNEATDLDFQDVDADGKPDLMFAYFASKYMVKARHISATGRVIEGPEVRMATSRTFGDLDGDGQLDEVVGRVYGDAKGDPGDLTVHFGGGPSVKVPVVNGVKGVLITRLAGDARDTLYVSDGWLADYGKQAKARIERITWTGRTPALELVATSPDEFTFFDLAATDLDGDGQPELVVQGDKRVTRYDPAAQPPWTPRVLAGITPVLNTAVGLGHVFVPAEPQTRAVPVPK
jgi:hypothetical protein